MIRTNSIVAMDRYCVPRLRRQNSKDWLSYGRMINPIKISPLPEGVAAESELAADWAAEDGRVRAQKAGVDALFAMKAELSRTEWDALFNEGS
ncbi:MAG: hypothetical protein GY906_38075 [bacterium]|nr:hypothetical protein [bacterium]